MKEATARVKIDKLLEAAGWRFFAEGDKPANIRLESSVTITRSDLDALGHDFEKISRGFVDFLLLDAKGFPLIVLEAKSEDKDPLVGKEQARRYARSQNCRFVILSNGNLHYFRDLERGNPYIITTFPSPDSVSGYREVEPHVPNAWIDTKKRDQEDGNVGLVGYEINFNRYFYQYKPPRPLEDIEADIQLLQEEIVGMLAKITSGTQ